MVKIEYWEPWCTFLGLALSIAGVVISYLTLAQAKKIEKSVIPNARKIQFIKKRHEYISEIKRKIDFLNNLLENEILDNKSALIKTHQLLLYIDDVKDLFPNVDKEKISTALNDIAELRAYKGTSQAVTKEKVSRCINSLCSVQVIIERDEIIVE